MNVKKFNIQLVKEKNFKLNNWDISNNLNKPETVAMALEEIFQLSQQAEEIFCFLALDTKNKVIGAFEVSRGSLNSSIVHPREIFKRAVLVNANKIVLGHNHPSNDPKPSQEDLSATSRLVSAGKILGIEVLDHIIIADREGDDIVYKSLKKEGLMG